MKAAIILGGGPAGCQCALWLKLLGHAPLILEQSAQLGGLQVVSPYHNNWLVGVMDVSGHELAARMQTHIERMDIAVQFNQTVTAISGTANNFSIHVGNEVHTAKTLVIATGVKARRADLVETDTVMIGPGERVFNYDFAGKRIAILGGGDNAYENYAFIKAKQPALCHVYARTIRARHNLAVAVNSQDVYSSPYQVNQAAMTITQGGVPRQYDVMVVLYGWEANVPKALEPFRKQLLDKDGFIATDAHCETQVPGIYAIGEVANRMHPCVATALADGVVAAKAIEIRLEA